VDAGHGAVRDHEVHLRSREPANRDHPRLWQRFRGDDAIDDDTEALALSPSSIRVLSFSSLAMAPRIQLDHARLYSCP